MYPCHPQDFIAEVPAELLCRSQIYLASDQLRQLALDAGHADQADAVAGLKFHQEIKVAVGAQFASQRGAVYGQLANMVALAERLQYLSADGKKILHL